MKGKGRLSNGQLLVACGLFVSVTVLVCIVFSMRTKEDGFGEFCQRLFVREMTANTIGLHYSLAHPERFGIKEYPVTLPIYEPGSELRASDGLMALWAEFQARKSIPNYQNILQLIFLFRVKSQTAFRFVLHPI